MPNLNDNRNGLRELGGLAAILGLLGGPPTLANGECDCGNCRARRKLKRDAVEVAPDSLPDAVRTVLEGYKDRPKTLEAAKGTRGHNAYDIRDDDVLIDNRAERRNEAEFCRLLFHELIHSTGAKHRLNRSTIPNVHEKDDDEGVFGKLVKRGRSGRDYALEEIIAELGAQALLRHVGLWTGAVARSSNAYLVGYAEQFWDAEKVDIDAVIREARPYVKAAVNYILGKGKVRTFPRVRRELAMV